MLEIGRSKVRDRVRYEYYFLLFFLLLSFFFFFLLFFLFFFSPFLGDAVILFLVSFKLKNAIDRSPILIIAYKKYYHIAMEFFSV